MVRATALCAFREPFDGGFVEAIYAGQPVDVPIALVAKLAADGHISAPDLPEAARFETAPAEPPPAADSGKRGRR